jgi:hypothetical protein
MDLLMDMSTYGLYGPDLDQVLESNIAVAKGVDHYGMGLLPSPDTPYIQLEQIFQSAAKFGVKNIYTWPDSPEAEVSEEFWEFARAFLAD